MLRLLCCEDCCDRQGFDGFEEVCGGQACLRLWGKKEQSSRWAKRLNLYM